RTEVQQDRRSIVTQVNVGRLQIQVQQLVGMHFAQAIHDLGESLANEALGYDGFFPLFAPLKNVVLQRSARFIRHDHVDGLVGTEEVDHADHVRMKDARQGTALLEEAFETDAEDRQVFRCDQRNQLARLAQGQRARQIRLDGNLIARFILRQIDNTEAAGSNLLYNAVSVNIQAIRQWRVFLNSHVS